MQNGKWKMQSAKFKVQGGKYKVQSGKLVVKYNLGFSIFRKIFIFAMKIALFTRPGEMRDINSIGHGL